MIEFPVLWQEAFLEKEQNERYLIFRDQERTQIEFTEDVERRIAALRMPNAKPRLPINTPVSESPNKPQQQISFKI